MGVEHSVARNGQDFHLRPIVLVVARAWLTRVGFKAAPPQWMTNKLVLER